jgi:hypothetical protein
VDRGAAQIFTPQTADTVRTNVWLVETLMAEVVAVAAAVLPAPPAAVELDSQGDTVAEELFATVAMRDLAGRGYTMYRALPDAADLLDEEEIDPVFDENEGDTVSEQAPRGDGSERYILSYRVVAIELGYPETGRRLGIWRQWVARDLALTVAISVQESATGRLLMSDRLTRSFDDRVPADDLDAVDSDLYPFTTAQPGESGWKSRFEEIVVLGALAALVAVYLSNTQ